MAIQFLEHYESSGFAARTDLAVARDGKIFAIFTIGVENGNTTGSLFHPFEKGMSLEEAHERVEEYNTPPEGAVCVCGAKRHYHSISAACKDHSVLREISADEALVLASEAKRKGVGEALFGLIWRLRRNGDLYEPYEFEL